jgi:CBS domain-containing protein
MRAFLDGTVQHNMAAPVKSVAPEMTVGDLLRLFAADQRDAYPVVRDGKLVGIVSKADALKAFASDEGYFGYDELMGTTVVEVMTRQVMTVEPGARLRQALHLMGAYRFESLPVVDDENHLWGMIERKDMVRVLTQRERPDTLPLVAPAVGYYAIA